MILALHEASCSCLCLNSMVSLLSIILELMLIGYWTYIQLSYVICLIWITRHRQFGSPASCSCAGLCSNDNHIRSITNNRPPSTARGLLQLPLLELHGKVAGLLLQLRLSGGNRNSNSSSNSIFNNNNNNNNRSNINSNSSNSSNSSNNNNNSNERQLWDSTLKTSYTNRRSLYQHVDHERLLKIACNVWLPWVAASSYGHSPY